MRYSFCLAAAVLAAMPTLASAEDKPVGLTLDQYLKLARSRISNRDADGDGRISMAEFNMAAASRGAGNAARSGSEPPSSAAAGMPPASGTMPGERGGDRTEMVFERFDADHDGYLDKAEIDAMLTARFARQDANHDGILTREERTAGRIRARGDDPAR